MNAMLRQRRKDDEMRAQGPVTKCWVLHRMLGGPTDPVPSHQGFQGFLEVWGLLCSRGMDGLPGSRQHGGKTRTSEQAHGEGKAFLWGALKEPGAVKIFHQPTSFCSLGVFHPLRWVWQCMTAIVASDTN